MLRSTLAALSALTLPLLAAVHPAHAAVQANLGVLTCTLAEAGSKDETPPSQSRAMICTFKPTGEGPEEHYSGEVQKVGTQAGLNGKSVLMWTVLGPDAKSFAPGLLEQTYVGKVNPTDSETQPPQMLVGETDETYLLRPMSDREADDNTGTVTVVVLKAKTIPS